MNQVVVEPYIGQAIKLEIHDRVQSGQAINSEEFAVGDPETSIADRVSILHFTPSLDLVYLVLRSYAVGQDP